MDSNVIRLKETEIHARIKSLLWLDKMHNDLKWIDCKDKYNISTSCAIIYVQDVLKGIMKTFKNENIVTFPSEKQKLKMVSLNKMRNKDMPQASFTMDGKHAKCLGKHISERLSYKFKFKVPCFNVLFLIERTFGTICAFNLDCSTKKHDITVLRESLWFQNIEKLAHGWIILADKGYIGTEIRNIAATLKDDHSKNIYPDSFWKIFNVARSDSERVFAHFFANKFCQLGNWNGKGNKTFDDWALNVTCCIIVYNILKLKNVKVC